MTTCIYSESLTATVLENHVILLGRIFVLFQEPDHVQHIGLVALGVIRTEGNFSLLDLRDLCQSYSNERQKDNVSGKGNQGTSKAGTNRLPSPPLPPHPGSCGASLKPPLPFQIQSDGIQIRLLNVMTMKYQIPSRFLVNTSEQALTCFVNENTTCNERLRILGKVAEKAGPEFQPRCAVCGFSSAFMCTHS